MGLSKGLMMGDSKGQYNTIPSRTVQSRCLAHSQNRKSKIILTRQDLMLAWLDLQVSDGDDVDSGSIPTLEQIFQISTIDRSYGYAYCHSLRLYLE
jgi:hypothetical protein